MLRNNSRKTLVQLDIVMYSTAHLRWNAPVGAGVMDCPIHDSTRKQVPMSNAVKDIADEDSVTLAIMRMAKNILVRWGGIQDFWGKIQGFSM